MHADGVAFAAPNGLLTPVVRPLGPGTIGVVTGELLRYAAFWRSLIALERPPGTAVAQAASLDLPTNRNRLAACMHGEWLFTLDDDLVLPPNTLMRLLKVLEQGEYDVVAAFSLRRDPPFDGLQYLSDPTVPPHCGPWVPDGRRGVMEIAACGLGAVLIHKRVFDALEQPYFRVGQIDPDHYQEDVEWCRRVREAGFRIAVDLDTPIGHTTPMAVWPARDQDGNHCVALAGVGGEIIPVDPVQLRQTMTTSPMLIGL
jgi:hypothetical protein